MTIRITAAIFFLAACLLTPPRMHAADTAGEFPIRLTLKVDWQKDLSGGQAFSDSTGALWSISGASLLQWNGKARAWDPTPVANVPHPLWQAHPAPPWQPWSSLPRVLRGRDGILLAVVVRDVYQDLPKGIAGADGMDWRSIESEGTALAAKRGKSHWLEARLLQNGKWSDQIPLEELLTANRTVLTKTFQEQSAGYSFFDLVIRNDELWWCDGDAIHVLDAQGKQFNWVYPQNAIAGGRPRETWQGMAKLLRTPDQKILLVYQQEACWLTLWDGTIVTKSDPDAVIPKGANAFADNTIHGLRNGTLWLEPGRNGRPWQWQNGKWEPQAELGLVAGEDADGALWFLPGGGEGTHSLKGYHIIKEGQRRRLSMPGNFFKGGITVVSKDKLLAAGGDRAILLARSADEPGWAVQDVLGLEGVFEPDAIWIDDNGNLVGRSAWSAQIPQSRLGQWTRQPPKAP